MEAGTSTIAAVRPVLPEHRYRQQEITAAFARLCLAGRAPKVALLDRFHQHAGVGWRHLALPLERYEELAGFGAANDAFIAAAMKLGERAVRGALDDAGLAPADVDVVVSTSTTGIAVPSLEARLVWPLGLRPDVRRLPLFGLGCAAGVAGLARLHDYLVGHPDDVGVLLSIELCSLTVQRDDASTANLVASALFGDGAAAVVLCGANRAAALGRTGPSVVASARRLYPDSERVMGWDVGPAGFQVVLGADVPDVVTRYLGADVRGFLAEHGLAPGDVTGWVCHPGGPRVLDAVQAALDLPAGALDLTWRSLSAVGNLSSASVLHVLRDTLAERPPPAGTPGVALALGPGFCCELVLLRW